MGIGGVRARVRVGPTTQSPRQLPESPFNYLYVFFQTFNYLDVLVVF